MSANCPLCCEGHIVRETWPETFEYRGVTLTSDYTQEYCNACGSLVQSPEVIRENVRAKQRAKNTHDKLLDAEEIRKFRDRFDISQRVASILFGGGPTAFSKYESDDIAHTISMDRLLRLCIMEPKNISRLAEISNVQLEQSVTRKIKEAEDEIFRASVAEAFAALAELSGECKVEPTRSANDAVFETFLENNVESRRSSSTWALDREMVA